MLIQRPRHWSSPDITGLRFGALVAIRYLGSNGKHAVWEVRCDCGAEKPMIGKEFRRGKIFSCGCQTAQRISESRTTHGASLTPLYTVYRSMLARCLRKNHPAFHNYGGRGITVCHQWKVRFENFRDDMLPTYAEGLDLERRNNMVGYNKENCRWATRTTNSRNKRNNTVIECDLGRMTVAEASDISGVNRTTIYNRVRAGWPADKLLLPPDFRNKFST